MALKLSFKPALLNNSQTIEMLVFVFKIDYAETISEIFWWRLLRSLGHGSSISRDWIAEVAVKMGNRLLHKKLQPTLATALE